MPKTLHIGPGFQLPLEAVTQTFAIVAKRGAGKTTTSGVMVEEMVRASLPVVVVDPVGVWWGLRSSADGKSPGLPVAILGGEHGDVPLEPTGGTVIADLLVDSPAPVVLDLSLFSKTEARSFMTAFLETLYRRNRRPLHVVLDEADRWAPQRVIKGGERLLGATEDLVRLGRARGLGVTLISQRPAVVNKDVLSQAEVLVAMQITGPHDRKAVSDWLTAHVDDDQRLAMVETLPGLPVGTAWFASPSWLRLFQQVNVRMKTTFDSSATPRVGQSVAAPEAFATVDLDALRVRMAETIERAEAADPKALQRKLVDLGRQLGRAQADLAAERAKPAPAPVTETITEHVVPPAVVDLIQSLESTVADIGTVLRIQTDRLVDVHATITGVAADLERLPVATPTSPSVRATPRPSPTGRSGRARPAPPVAPARSPAPESGADGDPGILKRKAEKTMLTVLVQRPAGCSRVMTAFLAGYSVKSSSVSNALGALRSAGYITKSGDPIQATVEGIAALGPIEPLPTGDELYQLLRAKLSKAEKEILQLAVDEYPNLIDRDLIYGRTPSHYATSSSSVSNALGRLRSLNMLDGWTVDHEFMDAIS